jgi:hypothetical protein
MDTFAVKGFLDKRAHLQNCDVSLIEVWSRYSFEMTTPFLHVGLLDLLSNNVVAIGLAKANVYVTLAQIRFKVLR